MTGDITASEHRAILRADSPWTILRHDWKSVLGQTWSDSGTDNIGLIAAGTAFWGFAAIAPLLAAVVLSYGLFATPETVANNIRALFGVLPRDAASLIADQLTNVVGSSGGKKGWALALALALALYGATQGASAIVTALNVAYEEKERRSIVQLYLLAFAITGAAVILAIAAAVSTTATAFLGDLFPAMPPLASTAIRFTSYLLLAVLASMVAALLYRFGPDRAHAKWVWLTPGSILTTILWLATTAAFAFYVANFGSYGATYGSLSAVIVLQLWLWLSSYIFLMGAELNSQLERRTARDTTTGPPVPLGKRGAAVADATGPDVPSL
ncbi:MAG: YihY/virulence factor BrkB family protein [Sphingomonas sp.]|uniref:YihY/virulence factor BrkB family protein n=1 Tax=Sphingomonas sp. TaxID=28214 RepID=UPI001AC54428|nr:YihY/virulence factor BrkB family protein [Sphingomonas sp.]MBN8808420.1 YihY/virulence factor BrkB family protein [Sphingomonas sp.]